MFNLSRETIRQILLDNNMTKVSIRWVPHRLEDHQKLERFESAKQNLKLISTGKLNPLDICTCDEKQFYLYTPYRHKKSKVWHEKGETTVGVPKSLKPGSQRKRLYCIFINANGLIFKYCTPKHVNINAQIYHDKCLTPAIEKIRSVHPRKKIHFLHDNAKPHTAHLVTEFLLENKVDVIHHPPYSPHTLPWDYFLFFQLSRILARKKFDSDRELGLAIYNAISTISKERFSAAFTEWEDRLKLVYENHGDYFDEQLLH